MASRILPLIILVVVVGILAVVGFVVYSIVQDISNKTRDKMEKKNVMFTRDGMKVGVKEVNEEDYVDRSQRSVYLSFSVLLAIHFRFDALRGWNVLGWIRG